jgi:hypothetical protein
MSLLTAVEAPPLTYAGVTSCEVLKGEFMTSFETAPADAVWIGTDFLTSL